MPKRMINGCEYFYDEHGTGTETVVFAHGLLLSGHVWHNQLLALRDRYRCIEYDVRGHGRSSAPSDGYSIEELAGDLIQLIETSGYTPCHLVGSALGGVVALRVALKRPELVRSLTLIGTSADKEPDDNRRRLRTLSWALRLLGMQPFVNRFMGLLFADAFVDDTDRKIQVDHWRNEIRKQNRRGMAQAVGAFARRVAVDSVINRLRQPTLIVVGEEDRVFPVEHSQRLHASIDNSRLVIVPGAGHCPPVETPDEVNQALIGFFGTLPQRGGR